LKQNTLPYVEGNYVIGISWYHNDNKQLYGRTTKFKTSHPEYLLFMNETGCNTRTKDDCFAGGQLLVLTVEIGAQSGHNGATTDIHFTALCFKSATGESNLCASILKYAKIIAGIPLLWNTGIDIRKNIVAGATRFDTFEQN
jgi:hypothetical protein